MTLGDEPLGLESGAVRVVPWHPAWPGLYSAEAARLGEALTREGIVLMLEHTGSTAVRGLPAKPVIDILAGLPVESARAGAIAALTAAGYSHRGEQGIPGRDFFRRGEPRQYHVHLALRGGAFWVEQRLFRDWLRTHPDAAASYGALKRRLAERHPADREAYIQGKSEFVASILRAARAAGGASAMASRGDAKGS